MTLSFETLVEILKVRASIQGYDNFVALLDQTLSIPEYLEKLKAIYLKEHESLTKDLDRQKVEIEDYHTKNPKLSEIQVSTLGTMTRVLSMISNDLAEVERRLAFIKGYQLGTAKTEIETILEKKECI